jgi:type II secretory pathway pseudopilin PulG
VRTLQLTKTDREAGFTIIEVMVAIFVLLIGVLGVALMVNNASAVTTTTKARVGAVNLAREVLEDARTLTYADLTTTQAQTDLQSQGLPDDNLSKAGWQVRRRGILFNVSLQACEFDDTHDGAHVTGDGVTYCPGSAAGVASTDPSVDNNPDDFRRVEVNVSWTLNGRIPACSGTASGSVNTLSSGVACVTQSELVANPSGGLGPAIVDVKVTSPLSQDPIETGNTISFEARTNSPATSLTWKADDGVSSGVVTTPVSGSNNTKWDFTWTLPGNAPTDTGLPPPGTPPAGGDVNDGPHTLTLQAFVLNAGGVERPTTVALNRYIPRAPVPGPPGGFGFINTPAGGVDKRLSAAVELHWNRSSDDDVLGYAVYRAQGSAPVPAGSGADAQVCSTADVQATSCFDVNPGAGTQVPCNGGDMCLNYYVIAFDRNWKGNTDTTGARANCTTWGSVTVPLSVGTGPLSSQTSIRGSCPSSFITIPYTDGTVPLTDGTSNNAPATPGGPTSCTTVSGLAQISWTPPPPNATDVDGDPVVAYYIYRDGTPAYDERLNILPYNSGQSTLTSSYVDPTPPDGALHTYYVTAVDNKYAESAPLAIQWSPGLCP